MVEGPGPVEIEGQGEGGGGFAKVSRIFAPGLSGSTRRGGETEAWKR